MHDSLCSKIIRCSFGTVGCKISSCGQKSQIQTPITPYRFEPTTPYFSNMVYPSCVILGIPKVATTRFQLIQNKNKTIRLLTLIEH